ncbi:MAG: helix-turn-helix transcriptional regulator [Actinomycetota bacterium]
MAVPKAERLLNLIVCLLETERPVTARQIHDIVPGYAGHGFESFKRMFERDKEALREVGIPLDLGPVVVEGQEEDGYRIPKDRYYLPDLNLGPEELAALWLAAGLVRLQDPGAARAALLKLSGDAPAAARAEADRARLSWLSADLGLAVAGLPRAFEAVAERKTVTFRYRSTRSGETIETSRVVDPYGLVHRKGAWYLVGLDHRRGEQRSFRLDRVTGEIRFESSPQVSPGPEFDPPVGFRPEEALELPPFVGRVSPVEVLANPRGSQAEAPAAPAGAISGNGQPFPIALVVFDAEVAWWVERSHPWLHLTPAAGGGAEGKIAVSDPDGFVSWVLSLGDGVEVLSPSALRQAVLTRLEALCG